MAGVNPHTEKQNSLCLEVYVPLLLLESSVLLVIERLTSSLRRLSMHLCMSSPFGAAGTMDDEEKDSSPGSRRLSSSKDKNSNDQ